MLAKHEEAVVCVRIVGFSYYELDGEKKRQSDVKVETGGTVLTPGGITAVPRFDGPVIRFLDDLPGPMSSKFEYTDVKMLLKNGREIPAAVIFSDDKFNIVYVAPKAKDLKLACIRFEKAKSLERLDRLISLARLDGKFDFEAEINIARVTALVKKPRPLIVTDGLLVGAVFDAVGRPVGIAGTRRGETQSVYGPDDRQVVVEVDALESGIREATKRWEKTEK